MPDDGYLMGIDTGTTRTKVGVYNLKGEQIAFEESPTPTVSVPSGGAEFNPRSIWENLASLIKKIPSPLLDNVRAVSIASFAETVYPLDSRGSPLDNGIAWFDLRTSPQNEQVERTLGTSVVREITGLSPSWIFSLNKILWFRENKPDKYSEIEKWLDNAGYILFKLSGKRIIDHSLACRTMMFDVKEACWSRRILDEFGIREDILPQPTPCGTPVGKVSKEASEETGLPESTLVVAGGHDHLCAAFSVGVIGKGSIQDSTGTTESILVALREDVDEISRLARVAQDKGFTIARHVVKDTFLLFQGMYCGGLLFDWFLKNVLNDADYSALEKVQYGENIPLFVPYLRGSEMGIMSGSLLGLKDFHKREHILGSITEAIAFELKKMVDSLEGLMDTSGWTVRSVGGGAKNKLLLQCKANLLDRDVEVSRSEEATSKGAALLAGMGCGAYKDEFEAVKQTLEISQIYKPEKAQAERIQKRYKKYCRVLAKYKDLEKELI